MAGTALAPATAASPDLHEPAAEAADGTDGPRPLPLSVRNLADREITCVAQLAHWYAVELGRPGPGGTITAELWHDPGDGTLALRNAGGDRMPVEAVWCAPADAPSARRARLRLPFRAGPPPERLAAACRIDGDGRLTCKRL